MDEISGLSIKIEWRIFWSFFSIFIRSLSIAVIRVLAH
jgi:hypothetical protein